MNRTDDDAIRRLADAMDRLDDHRFMKLHNSVWKMVGFQFLRGLALGLGTVVGATLMVSVTVYLLSQVELVPLIGTYATQIIEEIEASRQ